MTLVSVLPLVALAGAASGQVPFIPFGATWKYLDDGSDQGAAWSQSDFDDSNWASGPAELGYGESDQVTRVGFGGSAADKNITTYFRHTFTLPDPASLPGMKIDLLRDDGAVVFVNGIEVGRSNMPSGEITYTTPALVGLAGAAEKELVVIVASPEILVTGTNTIAVEIHQDNPGTSDMSFDLRATDAVGPTPPAIRNCLLAISASQPVTAITSENLSAVDFSSDEAALQFSVSGVESGRFELIANPGVPITEFSQAQITSGRIRFVYEPGRFGGGIVAGKLDQPLLHDEISGLVASIQNPGVLWAHQDSGNPAALIALGTDASSRGEWTLSGTTNDDWEDIAAATIDGQPMLYLGDFGDNEAVRTNLRIYRVKEPLLANNSGGTIPAADIETISIQYPESPAGEKGVGSPGIPARRDAESLIVDPHNGDLYILSKRESTGRLFRLAHQASYVGVQTLEYLGDMPAIINDTVHGFSTSSTAADISRDGLEIVLRNYAHVLYFQRADLDTSIAELLTGDTIEELPFVGTSYPGGEPIGEAICFSSGGDAYFTIGETADAGTDNPLFRYRRLPPNSPPAFAISVSDGALSDGPHAATVSFNARPMAIWRAQHFSAAELGDPALEDSLWGELADADGDRRTNLIEYALGTDPRSALGDEKVLVSGDAGSLTLTYEKDLSKTDVNYRVQASADLTNWVDVVDDVLLEAGGELETRRASVAVVGEARRYLRLEVSSLP